MKFSGYPKNSESGISSSLSLILAKEQILITGFSVLFSSGTNDPVFFIFIFG